MEDVTLLVIYLALLAAMAALFWLAKKRGGKLWARLLALEAVSAASALAAMLYFNSLPGRGMAPGLTYLGHVVFSMGAAAIYGAAFTATVAAMLWQRRKNKKV